MTPGKRLNIFTQVHRSRKARVKGPKRTASVTAAPNGSDWSGIYDARSERLLLIFRSGDAVKLSPIELAGGVGRPPALHVIGCKCNDFSDSQCVTHIPVDVMADISKRKWKILCIRKY